MNSIAPSRLMVMAIVSVPICLFGNYIAWLVVPPIVGVVVPEVVGTVIRVVRGG